MKKKNAFISFDFDNDEFLRTALVGQAKNPDSPFEIIDRSVKEPLSGDWKKKVDGRISRADIVIVICGEHTDSAKGVAHELQSAKNQKIDYFLLWGYREKICIKPTTASAEDKMYEWTWDNLKSLIKGSR